MTEFIVNCAMEDLRELQVLEVKHIPELRGHIEAIRMKLRQLQAILEIADARQEVDEGIRNWVAEIREVACDIENLLLEAICSKMEGGVFRKITHMFKEVTSFHKIQDIEDKISALESDPRVRHIKPYQNGSVDPISQRSQRQRRTYSHHFEEDIVGLDEDVEKLVATLVQEDANTNYQVVSIIGMGGIGKTTMAKRIYRHADVQSHFDAFAWACVSQQWQQEDVLQRILNKLEPEKKIEIKNMRIEELIDELCEIQRRKRCLIVLDDVRETRVWYLLRPAFHTRQVNIKVLFTTRNEEIACDIGVDAPCYLYEQRHLSEKESWKLLKKKVHWGLNIAGEQECSSHSEDDDAASSTESFHSCFTDEEEDEVRGQLQTSTSEDIMEEQRNQMDMERLGKEMSGQCGGLPLAIIMLGGLLMTKSTLSEWRTVHQNFNSYLRRGRSSRERGRSSREKGRSSREKGRVHEVLALSYHDLPYQLKPCFLHLGNFPEDFKIPTRKLYQLWAAEGFLSQESHEAEIEEPIMDIAECYLGELVQRCMVQVQIDEATGKFKSCWLHDHTRELCLVKGNEENFLKKIPLQYESEVINSPSSSAMATSISVTRRLSIDVNHDFDSYFPPRKENLRHTRSALFFSRLSDRKNLQPTFDFLCDEFKLLRVLDLERFDFGEKLSKSVGKLVYLRYLSLRGSQLYRLPSSLGNLKYLQTLDLRVPFPLCLSIPNVICKLHHLKHLYLPPFYQCATKLQLNNLSKLEILKNFNPGVSDHKDIPKLTKLQKLAAISTLDIGNLETFIDCIPVENNNIRDSSFRIIYDFQSERALTVLRQIVGLRHLHKLDLIGFINRLPEHCYFTQNLAKLILRNSKLKEDPMAILEKLPNLYSLILRENVFEGNEMCCSPQGFPRLRILELHGLATLEYWRIQQGAMPNLYCLKIGECVNLRMVPDGIEFIATLRELLILNMPEAFKRRVQKVQEEEGEDSHKVEHIPLITITETSSTFLQKLKSQPSGNSSNGILHNFYPAIVPKEWQNS